MTNRQTYNWRGEMRKSALPFPVVVVLLCFFIIPIALTVYYSFTSMTLSGSGARNSKLIDLENHQRMLTDPSTITAIGSTPVFLVDSLAGQTILGSAVVHFMEQKTRTFHSVVGPCFLVDWVMPGTAVVLCLMTFFKENRILNVLLGVAGIRGIVWLYEHPMLLVIIANVWHGTALSMLNFQSVLDNVSREIEEAARMGGANRFQVLTRIIVPYIKDNIVTNVMLNTLSIPGMYGLIYAMTGGGLVNKTTTLSVYMYNQGLKGMQLEFRTVIGMLILPVGIICSLVYVRILRSKDQKGTQHK